MGSRKDGLFRMDTLFGKALDYAYKLWPRLKRYTLDGRYQIDNNAVERGHRALQWLTYVLNKLHKDSSDEEIISMLPHNYEKAPRSLQEGIPILENAPAV